MDLSAYNNEDVTAMLRRLVMDNLETLQDDLDALKPNERIKALLDIAKYVLPPAAAKDQVESPPYDFEDRIRELLVRTEGDI